MSISWSLVILKPRYSEESDVAFFVWMIESYVFSGFEIGVSFEEGQARRPDYGPFDMRAA